jgi:hypothetical protein
VSNIYFGPTTTLHYGPNGNFEGSDYAPGADGFNLADVSSVSTLSILPTGVKALVYLGMTDGVTPAFQAAVQSFPKEPQIYGFFLADEPISGQFSAANLKAESDYILQVDPGVKTFITKYNTGTPQNPSYAFTPANTDIDLYGLDPYPVRPEFTGGVDYSVIAPAVTAAETEGIPQADIVPVYQAFGATSGAYSSWGVPTPAQAEQMLATWGSVVPNPAFDVAYSWGTQDGDTALATDPQLAQVFANMFTSETGTGGGGGSDGGGTGGSIAVTDNTTHATGLINANGAKTVGSATFTLTSTSATATLGSDSFNLTFSNASSVTLMAGSGTSTISQNAGTGIYIVGSGSLTVTGASNAADTYNFPSGAGQLTIEDFSTAKGDTLNMAGSFRRGFFETSDGKGGTLLVFPKAGAGHTIDLANVSSLPKSDVHFT